MENNLKDQHYKNMGITLQMDTLTFEAEATAFIVAEYYGIDASDYSFPYLATWGDAKSSELKESLKVIQRASGKLIDEIDAEIMRQRLLHTDAIAYRINGYGYLQLERNQEGEYDYQLRSDKLQLIESGHITTDLQIDEAAKEITSKHDIHTYRLHELDTEKLMTQLANRDEEIKVLARDIASQLKLVDDQTEPAEREAIEARVGADIEAGRGDAIDSLQALASVDERCEALLDQTKKYIDFDVVSSEVATIQIA